jgi:hypothetical protein
LLGERKAFAVIRFTVTLGLLLTRVWLPLCCPSASFQAARFCALFSRVTFLLRRRGQKATSLANRGGIPIAGQLEITLTYWRIGAPISYTVSLFANTHLQQRRSQQCVPAHTSSSGSGSGHTAVLISNAGLYQDWRGQSGTKRTAGAPVNLSLRTTSPIRSVCGQSSRISDLSQSAASSWYHCRLSNTRFSPNAQRE